eukprot:TRINITY_DN916_c0_g1_i2.p1 TRINITY_DN916_c0_g1~~TRINITY_DN916_c0_g1_i2.p1  ORF type:complete len:202 (-),score=-15.47 TRINITY_DN916_c0_g1_i2:539-1144(-)
MGKSVLQSSTKFLPITALSVQNPNKLQHQFYSNKIQSINFQNQCISKIVQKILGHITNISIQTHQIFNYILKYFYIIVFKNNQQLMQPNKSYQTCLVAGIKVIQLKFYVQIPRYNSGSILWIMFIQTQPVCILTNTSFPQNVLPLLVFLLVSLEGIFEIFESLYIIYKIYQTQRQLVVTFTNRCDISFFEQVGILFNVDTA